MIHGMGEDLRIYDGHNGTRGALGRVETLDVGGALPVGSKFWSSWLNSRASRKTE